MHRLPGHIQRLTQTSLGYARSIAHLQIGLYMQSEPKASESPQSPCAPGWWKQTTHSQTNLHVNKACKASTNLQTCHTGFTDYKEWDSTHRFKHTNVGAHRTTNRRTMPSRHFYLEYSACPPGAVPELPWVSCRSVSCLAAPGRCLRYPETCQKALDTLVK